MDTLVCVTNSSTPCGGDAFACNDSMYDANGGNGDHDKDSVAARVCWRRAQQCMLGVAAVVLFLLGVVVVQACMRGRQPIVVHSFTYFVLCFVGGALTGVTHVIITPLDLIKCRMQVGEYRSLSDGVRSVYVRDGHGSVWRALPRYFDGWRPTLIGYVLQGSIKFGLYEVLKYAMLTGHDAGAAGVVAVAEGQKRGAASSRSPLLVFLFASFCAEVVADLALAPWEAIKIRAQTSRSRNTQLRLLVPHMWLTEGPSAFYKALLPLLCRQVPSTMVKFASFEKFVLLLHLILRVVSSISAGAPSHVDNLTEVIISLLAGVLSGILCAIVSHPADTLLSRLNQRTRVTAAVHLCGGGGDGAERASAMDERTAAMRPTLHAAYKRKGDDGDGSETVSTHVSVGSVVNATASSCVSGGGKSSGGVGRLREGLVLTLLRQLGWRGLWRGIVPRLCMVAALTAMQWIMYDGFKMFVGLPGTGRGKA